MKENNPIDELFKKQLKGHEMPPSAEVWKKIEAAQQKQDKKAGGWYLMRAAVITLLIGLSSMLYFQRNEAQLMNPLPEQGVAALVGESLNTNNNNKNNKAAADEPEKENKAAKDQPEPAKKGNKPAKKAVPIMSRPSAAANILVQNDIQLVDEQALASEQETDPLESVAYTALDPQQVKEKTRYSITVKLPVVETYYGPDTTQPADERFSKKLWTYASSQLERVMAGEKPQWPKTEKEPELAFNVPRIFK